jgi:hypothetical protein
MHSLSRLYGARGGRRSEGDVRIIPLLLFSCPLPPIHPLSLTLSAPPLDAYSCALVRALGCSDVRRPARGEESCYFVRPLEHQVHAKVQSREKVKAPLFVPRRGYASRTVTTKIIAHLHSMCQRRATTAFLDYKCFPSSFFSLGIIAISCSALPLSRAISFSFSITQL